MNGSPCKTGGREQLEAQQFLDGKGKSSVVNLHLHMHLNADPDQALYSLRQ
jgi:hypothetical protein